MTRRSMNWFLNDPGSASRGRKSPSEFDSAQQPDPSDRAARTPTGFARLHDVLTGWCASRPEAAALVCGDVRLGYADLNRDVDWWAGYLLRHGVRRGDRVAVCSRPSVDAFSLYLASASIGAVFHGLNPAATEAELAHLLTDSAPRVLLDGDAGTALRVAIRVGLPHARRLASAREDRGTPDLAALRAQRAAVTPSDPSLLVYTSGSTGRPKGALLSQAALCLAGRVHAERWAHSPFVTLNPYPINHVASISDLFGTALAAGGTTVLQPRFDPGEALALLVSEKVSFWAFIPAAALRMVNASTWETTDLSAVQHTVWGGGTVSEALLRALWAKGLHPEGCYGSTETVANVCYTGTGISDDPAAVLSLLGHTVAPFQGRREPETGELQILSPHPFLGYLHQPEASAAAFTDDGWLRTGDVVEDTPFGYRLIGRLHDMYKSGGYNVYPREVELALEAHPKVMTAAVVAVPDSLYGEVGRAFVVLNQHTPTGVTTDDIMTYLRSQIAHYKLPKTLRIVPELPLLPVGKVDKTALRKAAP